MGERNKWEIRDRKQQNTTGHEEGPIQPDSDYGTRNKPGEANSSAGAGPAKSRGYQAGRKCSRKSHTTEGEPWWTSRIPNQYNRKETINLSGAMDPSNQEEGQRVKRVSRQSEDPGQEVQGGSRADSTRLGVGVGQPVRDNAKKRKTAKLLYFNARSILSKLDLLQLHVYDNKPELIAVCESFTNSDIGDALLGLEGYELISRKDGRDTTNGKCRGLLIYAKIGLQAMHCPVPGENTVTEISSIKIPWGRGGGGNQEFLQVVLVYRPPRVPGSKEDGGNTEQLYKVLGGLNGNVVVVGDFNLPSIDWERNWAGNNREEGLVDLVENKFWSQHVLEPTHEDGNTLDLCLSSQEDTVAGVEILEPLGNGDHNMLDIDLAGPLDNNDSVEEVPDWEKADITQLTAALHECMRWTGTRS